MNVTRETAIGFNGAAADQRRKLHIFIADLREIQRFNGAAADQRRKPSNGYNVHIEPYGFNGAAADQRRKLDLAIQITVRKFASMGPPLISGGNVTPPKPVVGLGL